MERNIENKNLPKGDIEKRLEDIEKEMRDSTRFVNSMVRKTKKKKKKSKIDPVINAILSEKECERLIKVCEQSKHPLENSFIVRTMMILGFRIGEVVHMSKKWVDFNNKRIRIPSHDPCCCGYCKTRIKERMKAIGKSKEEWGHISKEEILKYYWQPKTVAGARSVYYGFDTEYEKILKDFFARYDKWPRSVNNGYLRVKKMLKLAGLGNHVPHDLRKTGATNYASYGLSEFQLMEIMGWDDSKVARKYIRLAGIRGENAVKRAMDGGEKPPPITDSRIIFYITDFGRKVITRKKRSDDKKWLNHVLFNKEQYSGGIQTSLL
jgi:integrase